MNGERNIGRRRALQLAAVGLNTNTTGWITRNRSDKQKTPEVDSVSVILNWKINATQAGYFIAKHKGFYDEQGITVENLISGRGGTFAAKQVGLGRQPFGLSGAAAVLTAQSKNLPVQSYATSQQKNDGVVYTIEEIFDGELIDPKQLKDKIIAAPKDSPITTLTKAVLKRAGVLDSVKFLGVAPEQQTPMLLSGNADAAVAIFNSPVALERKGYNASSIQLAKYIPTVGRTVMAQSEFATENPKTVRAFLRGTAKGWAWAATNPEKAMNVMIEADPSLKKSREMGIFKIKYSAKNLIMTNVVRKNGWGWQRPRAWQTISNALIETGVVPKVDDVGEAWTNEHLDTNYKYIGDYADQVRMNYEI